VIKKIKELPISQKILWGTVIILTLLYFNLYFSFKSLLTRIYELTDTVYQVESGLVDKTEDQEKTIEELKELVCEHDEKLEGLSIFGSNLCP